MYRWREPPSYHGMGIVGLWHIAMDETVLLVVWLFHPDILAGPGPNKSADFENLNLYQVLEVSKDASGDDLKKAYRKKALEHHPDKNPSDVTEATKRFARVQKAYETLNDENQRADYDYLLLHPPNRESKQDDPEPAAEDNTPLFIHLMNPLFWFGLVILLAYYGFQGCKTLLSRFPRASTPRQTFTRPTSNHDNHNHRSHPFVRLDPSVYTKRHPRPHRETSVFVPDIIEYVMCLGQVPLYNEVEGYEFFRLIGNLFECIAFDEEQINPSLGIPRIGDFSQLWCRDEDNMQHHSNHHPGSCANAFYQYWMHFKTQKDFSWIGYTDLEGLPHSAKNLFKKENRKKRAEVKKAYEELIQMVATEMKNIDPRFLRYQHRQQYAPAGNPPPRHENGNKKNKKHKNKKGKKW